ncbi:phosphoesterase RecJ domain-containing protein [Leptolinea sp. HRD-7]|nr:phosphoesterase RecJ domain-containing protein [Leptolinea sp. HRD-7]
MGNPIDNEIRSAISKAKRIVVTSHIRPDQDAVGSLLALGNALEAAGKDVQMVLTDSISVSLRFLQGSDRVKRQAEQPFDLFISLDCSDTKRLGDALPADVKVDINIDHHLSNLYFGQINLVEPENVATCAVLASHLQDWGLVIDRPVAEALLVGILGDSLGFRTSNTTTDTLRLAANLVDMGLNLPEIYAKTLVGRSFSSAKYWGLGLEKLARKGRIVYTSLSLADRKKASYPGNDDADLINMLSTIDDADVAIMFVEQGQNKVKVSWRAIQGIDISKLALSFGGGGHPAASGAEIEGPLSEVQEKVISATINYLKNGDNKFN